MSSSGGAVRRLIFVALLSIWGQAAHAEPFVTFDAQDASLSIHHLTAQQRRDIVAHPDAVTLRLAGATGGMLLTVIEETPTIRITPRFRLLSGREYELSIKRDHDIWFTAPVKTPRQRAPTPTVHSLHPTTIRVPANALKWYLRFSEPMSRGQLRQRVALFDEAGQQVEHPFLNLKRELWDADQTQLTLLFDPGRVKREVGPNRHAGAPLVAGKRYTLLISGELQSAEGQPLGQDHRLTLEVGPAERTTFNPDRWVIGPLQSGSQRPLTIAFDRVMDASAARHAIRIQDNCGQAVIGTTHSDGTRWHFTPVDSWRAGHYSILIDPALEDIAGNTMAAPFDRRFDPARRRAPAPAYARPFSIGENASNGARRSISSEGH
ncbi:MAG: Ig-like domain-containing protein [Pseudomonadota bacterium]